ncbi:hypothetical protein Pmani_033554 [Petrolisthes manimaculis]|uniref:Uncharacterized protein n=2 Tax=Petrolisthes manimaculis TaxID=1843537 RepID=A0AAE1NR25_9EUCA|nr:hypothetical protein Pmani_033554 [Petrolisthes manimaculis]
MLFSRFSFQIGILDFYMDFDFPQDRWLFYLNIQNANGILEDHQRRRRIRRVVSDHMNPFVAMEDQEFIARFRLRKDTMHDLIQEIQDELLVIQDRRAMYIQYSWSSRDFMNVEEAVTFLHSLSNDEDATTIDITLESLGDGAESDGDIPSEDIVDVHENIMLLGPKLLDKPPHIELTNRNTCAEPCWSMSSPIGLQSQQELPEPTSHTRKIMKTPKKHLKKIHEWKKCVLEQSNNENQSLVDDHQPTILYKWADEGLTPIDIFKYMWNDEVMELMREETNRYHQQKFGKELSSFRQCRLDVHVNAVMIGQQTLIRYLSN